MRKLRWFESNRSHWYRKGPLRRAFLRLGTSGLRPHGDAQGCRRRHEEAAQKAAHLVTRSHRRYRLTPSRRRPCVARCPGGRAWSGASRHPRASLRSPLAHPFATRRARPPARPSAKIPHRRPRPTASPRAKIPHAAVPHFATHTVAFILECVIGRLVRCGGWGRLGGSSTLWCAPLCGVAVLW